MRGKKRRRGEDETRPQLKFVNVECPFCGRKLKVPWDDRNLIHVCKKCQREEQL